MSTTLSSAMDNLRGADAGIQQEVAQAIAQIQAQATQIQQLAQAGDPAGVQQVATDLINLTSQMQGVLQPNPQPSPSPQPAPQPAPQPSPAPAPEPAPAPAPDNTGGSTGA